MTTRTPLAPGFMVVHGNHPESLRDLMLSWMTLHPLAPLEEKVIKRPAALLAVTLHPACSITPPKR